MLKKNAKNNKEKGDGGEEETIKEGENDPEILGSGSKSLTLKEELENLYAKMKEHGINSIGDLEVKISRL